MRPDRAEDGHLITETWTLWEDGRFVVTTPANPHLPPEEGCHLVVQPKDPPPHAWADPALTGATVELAARVSQVIERLGLVEWVNLQANGNWGLRPGATPHLHVHIYGRRRGGKTWAQPVDLPKAPGQFGYAPLSEADRPRLTAALTGALESSDSAEQRPSAKHAVRACVPASGTGWGQPTTRRIRSRAFPPAILRIAPSS